MELLQARNTDTRRRKEIFRPNSCVLTITVYVIAFLSFSSSAFGQVYASSSSAIRVYSTIRSIGIEWDITGDSNHNAKCGVQYRKTGESSWKEGLPLVRVDYRGYYGCTGTVPDPDNGVCDLKADRRYNMLAGSILFADPGTTYEVKLDLQDQDGGNNTIIVTTATRPVPVSSGAGQTYHVVPGSGGGAGTAANPFKGLAAAEAAAQPGDTFILHVGTYGAYTFTKAGNQGNYVVWRDAGDGEVTFSAVKVGVSWLWLEGLTLRGTGSPGLGTSAYDTKEVVIYRNRFEGFHYAISLLRAQAWYIADNVIYGDKPAQPDPNTVSQNVSGEGIELNGSNDMVVAHNLISNVADGVSYPGRNCDIYGNDIYDTSDDGVEADGGYANIRIWENRITDALYNGIGFQPMANSPWYIIRNQIVLNNAHIFKLNVMDRVVAANNLFVGNNVLLNGAARYMLNSVSRNNLWIRAGDAVTPSFLPGGACVITIDKWYCGPYPNRWLPDWRTDIDYDGFDQGNAQVFSDGDWGKLGWIGYQNLQAFSAAAGIEAHAISVKKAEIFEQWTVPADGGKTAAQYITLKPVSNAIDAGQALPNINDNFSGIAPDLGPYECRSSLPHYGPRHLPVRGGLPSNNGCSPASAFPPAAPAGLRLL